MLLGAAPGRAAVANLLSGLCFSPCPWLLSTLGKCILSALSCVFVILIEFSLHVNSQYAQSKSQRMEGRKRSARVILGIDPGRCSLKAACLPGFLLSIVDPIAEVALAFGVFLKEKLF